MFSGRIAEVGTVTHNGPHLVIEAAKTAARLTAGDSVAVNGTRLAAQEVGHGWFSADISGGGAPRSALPRLVKGSRVNLELPLHLGDPVDGHLVQGYADEIGNITAVEDDPSGGKRIWIRPPRQFLLDLVANGLVAVDGVSVSVAELLNDRFSVALIPITQRETTLGSLTVDDAVNLEADLFTKSARDLHTSARLVATRSFAALPWAGELTGAVGVEKTAAQLAAGGAVIVYDPDRENEADVIFAGAALRPESVVFLLTQVCGHTTVPCDEATLERLEIPGMPGAGDRHGTAYHVSVDLAAGTGTGVSAHERAATIRHLANPSARPEDFLRPGHVFPLAGRRGGLAERQGHTEASLALCQAAGLPPVAAICEVMGPDGHMLSGSAVERFALQWGIPMIAIGDLVQYL